MTSKEALSDLVAMATLTLNKDVAKRLAIIAKDLEVLDILKESIFNKETHEYKLAEKFKGQKFMLLSISIRGDENILKIKEWLENEN